VLRAFFLNRSMLSCIMGPVGGGKSLAAFQRCIYFARLQAPHPIDKVRRTRWVIIRGTYRDLERTSIKTWNEWWPRDLPYGEWKGGGNGEPATHRLIMPLPDGTTVETEIIFAAVGEHSIEEFAGGFEITGFVIEEATDLPEELAFKLLERVGRYPRVDKSCGFEGATFAGGWLTCNAPNYGNHIELNFVTDPKPDFEFFRQPGGLDPDAENLENLRGGRKYYEGIAANSPDYYVRRMVHNQFGFDRSGKPVYPEYNPFKHYSKTVLPPMKGLRVVAGVDQGQSPAVVFQQRTKPGQLRIMRCLAVKNVGPFEFGRMVAEFASDEFPGFDIDYVVDPAAFNKTDISKDDEDVWAMLFEAALGQQVRPAKSNKRAYREAALRQHMIASLDGQTERLLISNCCKIIHSGFNQMFRYKKVSASGQPDRYSLDIEKNDESHPCEAAEYGSTELVSMNELLGRAAFTQTASARDDREDYNYRPVGM
jgi:hypothetical protein